MKKVLQIIFIALILAMGLVLSAGVIICGPSEPGANEKLSGTPALHNKDGSWNDHFLKDTATWFSDHFFLRQELISLNNRISAVLFNTSGEESVIIGKEGWLYFESTLDDYTGRNPMTDKELSAAAHNLELMAQFCREQGKDFVFIIAPNKNSLYPQFMPDFGVVAHERDAQKLLSRLENTPIIDLFSAFEKESEILYFRTDSHWNSKGAALAADLINRKFGKDTAYFTAPYSYRNDYTGDLFTMIYPAFSGDETQPYYGGKLDFRYTGKATKPDSITLLTESDKGGNLLVYRDSFGNLLYPYLADSYGSVRFSRSTSYDLTPEADHVVVELVERNLDYLISYLPVMPSPAGNISMPEQIAGSIGITLNQRTSAPDGYNQWTGLCDYDAGDTIYVITQNGAYDAFQTKDGFGVYLPESEIPTDVVIVHETNQTRYQIT